LSADQTIVIAGQQRIQQDGTPVRVVELKAAPGGAAPNSGQRQPQ
jgi:hypothetical protein